MECMTLTRRRERVQDLLTCYVCVDLHEVLHHALFDFVSKYNPNQPPFVALLVINSGRPSTVLLDLDKKE